MQIQSLSNCDFENAENAFFPLMFGPDKRYQKLLPKTAQDEPFIGIAKLKPIVANRLFLKAENGKTYFNDEKMPLGFSLLDFEHDQSIVGVESYWNTLRKKRQQTGPMIMWHVAPTNVCERLFTDVLKGKGKFYYHDPALSAEQHYFGITHTDRIKTYRISNEQAKKLN